MFLGSYHTKCLLNDLKGKPYNKTKVLIKDIIEKVLVVSILIIGILLIK